MSSRSGCAEADARYTAIVLDADVVAVVLDRGLDSWLRSNFSAMPVGFADCMSILAVAAFHTSCSVKFLQLVTCLL